MAVDLPDRIAGVDLRRRHHRARLTQIGAGVTRPTATAVTATPPSWRPDLVQPADLVEEVLRLEGLEVIPSVLPQAPGRPRPHRRAEAPPRDRQVAGAQPAMSRSCRRRSCPPGCSTCGACRADDPRRTTTHGAQPAGGRPPEAGHHAAARAAGSVGAATSPAAASTPRCSPSRRWCEPTPDNPWRRAHPDRPPAHRRRDRDARRVAARQPQHVGVVLAGLREPRGPVGSRARRRRRRRVRGGADHRRVRAASS